MTKIIELQVVITIPNSYTDEEEYKLIDITNSNLGAIEQYIADKISDNKMVFEKTEHPTVSVTMELE